jgi:hypothetical protein
MKPKFWLVLGLVTVGLVPVALWAFAKIRTIEVSPVSEDWLMSQEYDKEGYVDV